MSETEMKRPYDVAILGGGNLGAVLARGWAGAGMFTPERIALTRRQTEKLAPLEAQGYVVTDDNKAAVRGARLIVIAVQPQQLAGLLEEIGPELDPERHRVVSVVSGASIQAIQDACGKPVPVVRAMPNTAVLIGESMTCLAVEEGGRDELLQEAEELFGVVGRTLVIPEEMIVPATALCACGIAFFLRTVRAAAQGGIEIGFHPEDAALLAAQTAKGAASLALRDGAHPEGEIDRVTTPRGCTITGLNEMEHHGLSSAMIRGIVTSARAAADLYTG
ncbi:MAG: pyrroline-5-carboxylate reductase [Gemmatimonadota bacterium]|nr:pyrroline-5-carboxylate reductase [Gemmatimonadota bacterium]